MTTSSAHDSDRPGGPAAHDGHSPRGTTAHGSHRPRRGAAHGHRPGGGAAAGDSPNAQDFQLRARFRHAIRTARIADGSDLLIAVSGGCDSVVLLRLCLDEAATRGWRLTVGHVDHGLRSGSSADADWVRSLAAAWDLPVRTAAVPREHWQGAKGISIEAEARRLRRRELLRMREEVGATWILLGHNRDDQAETVLLNLIRGSGLRGLSGMAMRRPPWLRPLLAVTRGQIRGHAERRWLEYREDPTNLDPRFLRNRVRHRLMPLLTEEFHPSASAVLARTAESLRPVRLWLQAEARRAWDEVRREAEPGTMRLERVVLASYHQAVIEEVLWQAYRSVRGTGRDLSRAHISALVRAVRSGRRGRFFLPGDLVAVVDSREVRVSHQYREHSDR